MNIVWLFLVALVGSIGWYTGRCIVHSLDDFAMKTFYDLKIVKEYRNKKESKHNTEHKT